MEKHNTAFSNKSSQCVFFIGVKVLPKTQSLSLTVFAVFAWAKHVFGSPVYFITVSNKDVRSWGVGT